jgi:hypothetical protein
MNDFQTLFNAIADAGDRERQNYHLTYGKLIQALKAADKDAVFDPRVKGMGSYRGYYVDIALYTDSESVTYEDEAFDYDNWDGKRYDEFQREHVHHIDKLPTKAHELAELLESLLGKDFTGWKGGNYTITEDKPLWLETEPGQCSSMAVVDITDDLKLVTKEIAS